MLRFSFGRKRKSKKKALKKPPKALIKRCRKYRIRVFRKVGGRKVYKSISVLKRQLKKKIKSKRKQRKSSFGKRRKSSFGKTRRRTTRFRFGEMEYMVNSIRDENPWWSPWKTHAENEKARKKYEENKQNLAMSAYFRKPKGSFFGKKRSRFGNVASSSSPFTPPSNYGYNQKVQQTPGVLSQSSQVVTPISNSNRPDGLQLGEGSIPTYGVYRPFYTEKTPAIVPPQWGFMGQPDGSLFPIGGPFSRYTKFGKKRRNLYGRMSNE